MDFLPRQEKTELASRCCHCSMTLLTRRHESVTVTMSSLLKNAKKRNKSISLAFLKADAPSMWIIFVLSERSIFTNYNDMNKSQSTIKLSSSRSQDIMKNYLNFIRTDIIMVDCHCQKRCAAGIYPRSTVPQLSFQRKQNVNRYHNE